MNYDDVTATNCSVVGFSYFITHPKLWLGPLLTAFLSFCALTAAFIVTAYLNWPQLDHGWFEYTWGMFKSLGYASFTIIALWVSVFPILLNFAFENMIRKIMRDQNVNFKEEGTFKATLSSIQVIFRTLGWRLFWPIVTLFSLFLFGPLALILAQIGIGHITLIDATDLSMAIQGIPGKKRIQEIKKRSPSILLAGLIAGLLSMILSATIVGWFFYLPGLYVGGALWTLTWQKKA